MCEPATITMLAIAAVSAIAAQDSARSSANKQQDALYSQAQDDANTRGLQMNQVSEAAAQQANDRNKAAREEGATFDAIAGEYGGGATAARGSANIAFNQQADLSTIGANKDRQLAQLGHESIASGLAYKNQLASIARPSTLGTGLKIAGAAASAYGSYQAGAMARDARASKAPDGWDLSKTNRGSGD